MRARDTFVCRSGSARNFPWLARALPLFAAGAIVLCSAILPRAAERPNCTALRDRGLYELALDYLSQMESSPLADDAFQSRIGYHRGMTLLDQGRQTIDRDQRTALLSKARDEFDRFTIANPGSTASAEAMLEELANVFVELGERSIADANQLPAGNAYADERNEHRAAARRAFDEAEPMFRAAEKFYDNALDQIPKHRSENSKRPDRVAQGIPWAVGRVDVLAAQMRFEKAGTYDSDSKKFRELHVATAKDLAELYEKCIPAGS